MVINKVGGSGSICFDEIIKSKPDGYKILMATIGQVVLYPARNPKLPLHWDDVNYVARTQVSPNILLVAKKSPLKNLQDLVNKLKENPGKLKYGATGLGAVTQLGPCILLKEIGLKVTDAKAVNYDSDPEGIMAMVRGETDFWQGNLISAASSISSGIVRPLAVTTSERVKGFDDVPTYKELGYPGINITAWRAVALPKTTPPEVVKTLEAAIEKTTKSKPWLKTITNMGDFPAFLNSEDTNKFVGDEFKRFRTLFTELGLLVN
jgi:tripartite-type tricarboxylate transporter receptor subunit TctC